MKRKEIIILSLLLLFYFLWFAVPVSRVGNDDFRMADAFNVDEAESLQRLSEEVKNRGLDIPFYLYGHLYFNSGLVPLELLDIFYPVSEQTIILLFRILSALFFAGTVVLAFLTGKFFFGNITAWLSVLILLTISPYLYVYSAMVHPDTAQLFFISLGIFLCCKYFSEEGGKKWKYLAYAAFAAGLAFSSKYAGIMLMPLIIGIDLLEKPRIEKTSSFKLLTAFFFCASASLLLNKEGLAGFVPINENSEGFFHLVSAVRILSIAAGVILFIRTIFSEKTSGNIYFAWVSEKIINTVLFTVIFIVAFTISSPGCVRDLNFINGFIFVTDAARHGHWFKESLGIIGWIKVLLSGGILNYPVFLLFLFQMPFFLWLNRKNGKEKMAPSVLLLSWVVIYFTILALRINSDFAHYLIPVLPCIVILSANSLELLGRYVSKKITLPDSYTVAGLSLILLGYSTYYSSSQIFLDRETLVNKVNQSDAVKAGRWLKENFPPETRILYDRYSYVPGKFHTCFSSWGISQNLIRETNPGLIVINEQIYQRFINRDNAASFLGGSKDYLEKHSTYKQLLEGNSKYKLLKDFGKVKIFSIENLTY